MKIVPTVAAVLLPALVTLSISTVAAWPAPYSYQYVCVTAVVAMLGGLVPGLIATALSAIAVGFVWHAQAGIALLFFTGACVALTLAGEHARRREAQAAASRAAWEASESRHRAFFDNIVEAGTVWSVVRGPDGGIRDFVLLECNAVASQLFRRPSHEIVGHSVTEIVDPAVLEARLACFRRVLETGRSVNWETRQYDIHTAVTAFPLGPGMIGALGVNVTESKQALEELHRRALALDRALEEAQEGRATLDALMEHIPMGITIADAPDVRIRAVSRFGRDLIQSDRRLIEQIPVQQHAELWRVFRPDGVTPASTDELPLTRAAVHGETVREEEWVLSRADGSRIPILCTAAPIRTGDGKISGGVMGWQDITDRKRAELVAREMNQTLERRVRERTSQLEEANRELEGFTYSVSHDLRAPLRHVAGFTQVMMRNAADRLHEDDRRLLETVAESALRAGQLVDDLLAFSRTGRTELRQTTLDMNVLVRDVQRTKAVEIGKRNVHWSVGELHPARGDASLVRQVLLDLVSNALKFTRPREQARIAIGSEDEGHYVRYFVADNGVGFDMRHADRMFGVFERLHADEEFEGTGIGLANVRRIVERHGGRVWAVGEPGLGATFYFTLPGVPASS